jgi:YD repeat-containing protein
MCAISGLIFAKTRRDRWSLGRRVSPGAGISGRRTAYSRRADSQSGRGLAERRRHTLTYYDSDLAKSIAQGSTTTNYTLDALDRRSGETVTDTSGSKLELLR